MINLPITLAFANALLDNVWRGVTHDRTSMVVAQTAGDCCIAWGEREDSSILAMGRIVSGGTVWCSPRESHRGLRPVRASAHGCGTKQLVRP